MSLRKALARTAKLQTMSATQICIGEQGQGGGQHDGRGPTERKEQIRRVRGRGGRR
jgi:hypothetical protein